LGQIQQASSGSADFFKVLETRTSITDRLEAAQINIFKPIIPTKPIIEFENIYFEYEKGKHVLKNINFCVYGKEKLALVGESGQGKSTIVNLLLRYYEPQKGRILINNQDISSVTQVSLHENIAVVFQESLLFSGTIVENIRYGRKDSGMKDIISAAKAANAHDFIMELPDKYDSLVGERGVKLSGGQKQRIAIARAIIKDAPISILDEATSSLDSKSEVLVQKGLDRLLNNRTSIIIAHRLSTIANADHILVVSQGTVNQYGTSKELLNDKNGLYAQLVALQHQLIKTPSEEKKTKLQKFDLVA
ncbi:iron ABC transporter ATP-binding protein, partial [Candidatus Roizmanbacteria bacterium CG22_combo_CG10-13_8_21_14_all_35_9]